MTVIVDELSPTFHHAYFRFVNIRLFQNVSTVLLILSFVVLGCHRELVMFYYSYCSAHNVCT